MRRLTSRSAQRQDAGCRGDQRGQLQRLEKLGDRPDPGDAVPSEERTVRLVVARQGPGVRRGHQGPSCRRPHLQRHDPDATRAGATRNRGDGLGIGDRLELDTQRGDAVVVEQSVHQRRQVEHRLVACGDDHADVQASPRHRQVDPDVAALGDDGDAPLARLQPVHVRPYGRAVEGIHVPVAVRTEQRHRTGGLGELRLQGVVPRLAKARRVDDGAVGADPSERGDHVGGGVSGHRHEGHVRRSGQVVG